MFVHGFGDSCTPSLVLFANIFLSFFPSFLQTCIISTDLACHPFDHWPLTLWLIPFLKTNWWLSTCSLQSFYNPTFPYQHCQLQCTHHVIWNAADYEDLSHPCLAHHSFSLSLSPILSSSLHPFLFCTVPEHSLAVWLKSVTRQNEDVK